MRTDRPARTSQGCSRSAYGRYPCVELQSSFHFIPNDYAFSREEGHVTILTGPNMGGKSTYIRWENRAASQRNRERVAKEDWAAWGCWEAVREAYTVDKKQCLSTMYSTGSFQAVCPQVLTTGGYVRNKNGWWFGHSFF